ncbi:IclR family transcriptional regulator [Chelativorans sp. SCAU2101]|uniref:IclR family transcriptional regulator n=1 Tax=Chelativorans petroleitrophicus TaxID=2975484 RepID=A0A9X2XCD6_9HYPH|nr:IclR family transcriptional regulator [Chelativorans petroleitrophicus]MCT8992276.1 IclR family transcriptional regulator [Chelativorans petroleitrophicus]
MPRRKTPSSKDNLKSLHKLSTILDCFSTAHRALSLADICRMTGYPRSTTHRLLASMKEVGLLDQDRERERYRLGIKLFTYGNIVLANMDLYREARPFIDALGRMTGLSVHLAVFGGERAVVVHRAEPLPGGHTPINLVENAPMHCTSIGKAILAFQPETLVQRVIDAGLQRFTDTTITDGDKLRDELSLVRQRGYAVDNSEHQPGLRCVGAPIRDQFGRVIASISANAAALHLPPDRDAAVAAIVIHHAMQISKHLGYEEDTTQST